MMPTMNPTERVSRQGWQRLQEEPIDRNSDSAALEFFISQLEKGLSNL